VNSSSNQLLKACGVGCAFGLLLLFVLLLRFLAGCDHQIPKGVSDLFSGLLVGHNGVASDSPSSASTATALLTSLFLEESGTNLFVKHPDDRFDDVGLVLSCGRVDIPLQVHLDGDSEPPVADVVVGTAVASADNVVWTGFRDLVGLVGGHGFHLVHSLHVVAHVEHAVELVSADNVGGRVDNGSSGWLAQFLGVIGIIANHAGAASHRDSL